MKFEMPYELVLGWRYTRAGRATRRNGFISFISGVSMLGIGLGVAALVIVLSVMNGFQKEVRDRMLSVVAHVEVFDVQGQALADWRATAALTKENPAVVAAAPFIAMQSLIARGDEMRGAVVAVSNILRVGGDNGEWHRLNREGLACAWDDYADIPFLIRALLAEGARCPGEGTECCIVHRDNGRHGWQKPKSVGGFARAHREAVANRQKCDFRLVEITNDFHVTKDICVSGEVNGRDVRAAQDKACRFTHRERAIWRLKCG